MADEFPIAWVSMLSYKDTSGRVRMVRRGEPAVDISPAARERAERLGAFDPPEKQGHRDVPLAASLPPIGGVQPLDGEPLVPVAPSAPVVPVPSGDPGASVAPQPSGPDAANPANPAQTEAVPRPAQTANKEAWVEFGVARRAEQGAASDELATYRDELEAMTKADLIAQFKG